MRALKGIVGRRGEAVRQGRHHGPRRRGGYRARRDDLAPARSRSTWRRASAVIPRGRVVEIYGPESSGKTTLALHAIAEAQRNGGVARVHRRRARARRRVRARHRRRHRAPPRLAARHGRAGARDRRDARPLGRGRSRRHRLRRGAHAEGGDRGRDGRPAHGPPSASHEPGAPQAHGDHASHGHDASSSSTSSAKRSASPSAAPETTTGGNALKFYASMRLDVRRIGQVKLGDEIVGGRTRVKSSKE